MNVTKCDKCGKIYSPLEELGKIAECELDMKYWRYELYFDAHPYPQEKVDLCKDCKKKLYHWLRGVGEYAEK